MTYIKTYLRGGYDNVPDDWDQYWMTCNLCGQRYHASDGGCSCTDSLPDCACGKNDWSRSRGLCADGELRCTSCGSTPGGDRVYEEDVDD